MPGTWNPQADGGLGLKSLRGRPVLQASVGCVVSALPAWWCLVMVLLLSCYGLVRVLLAFCLSIAVMVLFQPDLPAS
jgi:hypothetical protein